MGTILFVKKPNLIYQLEVLVKIHIKLLLLFKFFDMTEFGLVIAKLNKESHKRIQERTRCGW